MALLFSTIGLQGKSTFFVKPSEEELREKGTADTTGPCMKIDCAKVVDAASADGGTE